MELFRQEYWNGLPFPSPEELPNPGIKPWSPALQGDSLPFELPGKLNTVYTSAKFRVKLKKVRKTTRPFMYDLNQIPYDYTVEVRNRFKGLDLKECLMNYGMRFVTLYRRQGSRPFP